MRNPYNNNDNGAPQRRGNANNNGRGRQPQRNQYYEGMQSNQQPRTNPRVSNLGDIRDREFKIMQSRSLPRFDITGGSSLDDYRAYMSHRIKTEGVTDDDNNTYRPEPQGVQLTDNETGQKIIIPPIPAPEIKFPGVKSHYIEFDASFANSSSDFNAGKLVFDINTISDSGLLNNVVDMYIFPFYIPEIDTPTTKPVYFFQKRVNILIEELSGSSFSSANGTRFHFPMLVTSKGIANYLSPDNDDGTFTFADDSVSINRLTFEFRAPVKQLRFPNIKYTFTTVAGSNPGRITLSEDHGVTLASSIAIFISNFSSTSSPINALMNDEDGAMVTASGTDEFTLPAGFDFTSLGVFSGELVIGVRSFSFRMRFRTRAKTNNNLLGVSN